VPHAHPRAAVRATTAILISHDLAAIELLCDRVMMLEGGRAVDSGEPGVVVRAYRQRLVRVVSR
jgi:ABC-type polysaccharide/polyol phosphate transport system ATPase subunit